MAEVFRAFLRLGLTSFGGPIAHLGYFRRELVQRRRWLSEQEYAEILALCQFLPGPASSQTAFALGLCRAGWGGALAAFTAFTLPSAALLSAFALSLGRWSGPVFTAVLHALGLVAVAVVGHAVVGMTRRLVTDLPRAVVATAAAAILLAADVVWMQIPVLAGGALLGSLICRRGETVAGSGMRLGYGRRLGAAFGMAFVALVVCLPWLGPAAAFLRAGALVFGGGHVVLPLLESSVVGSGWVTQEQFLAGYGAAQAVPGPLFTFAAYLGALLPAPLGGLAGAALALVAIFVPGFLLLAAVLPFWQRLTLRPSAAGAVAGVNAAVVGLLAAALWDPVWTSAVSGVSDALIALAGFAGLTWLRAPAVLVVAGCVGARLALSAVL